MFQSNIIVFREVDIAGQIWFEHFQLDESGENIEPQGRYSWLEHLELLGGELD